MSPLATMTSLHDLELGGDYNSLRIAPIGFLHELPPRERLVLACLIVDSKDCSPLLSLRHLTAAWVMQCRGHAAVPLGAGRKVPGWME